VTVSRPEVARLGNVQKVGDDLGEEILSCWLLPLASSRHTPYKGETVEVLQHPTIASLYAICATFADLPLAKLFHLIVVVIVAFDSQDVPSPPGDLEALDLARSRAHAAALFLRRKQIPLASGASLLRRPRSITQSAPSPRRPGLSL
jgi:hypothetical protein